MFDAVLIPGGGVDAQGEILPWIRPRFDAAVATQPGGPFLALSGGTFHKPSPLDTSGRPVFEAYAGVRYLLRKGVPEDAILTEISSYDTVGNAFFARVQHTDVRGWRKLLIVNGEYHAPRAEAIFRWVFSLEPLRDYELHFRTTPDLGMPSDLLAARRQREQASLSALSRLMPRFRSLADLHRWLYAAHEAYRAESVSTAREVDPDLAWIY